MKEAYFTTENFTLMQNDYLIKKNKTSLKKTFTFFFYNLIDF